MPLTAAEQEYQNGISEAIKPLLSKEHFVSSAEFNQWRNKVRDLIFNQNKHPDGSGRSITPDLPFYQRAFRQLFGDPGVVSWDPDSQPAGPQAETEGTEVVNIDSELGLSTADAIYAKLQSALTVARTNLSFDEAGKAIDEVVEKFRQLLENSDLLNETNQVALALAASHLLKDTLSKWPERKKFVNESELIDKIWKKAYKSYREMMKKGTFNEAVHFPLIIRALEEPLSSGEQWQDASAIRSLFEQTYDLDTKLDNAILNTDASQLAEIDTNLAALKTAVSDASTTTAAGTNVSATNILHARLKEKRDHLHRLVHKKISNVDDLAARFTDTSEDVAFKEYATSLNLLIKELKSLRDRNISSHNISPEDKERIKELLGNVEKHKKFLKDDDLDKEKEVLTEIHHRAVADAKTILGDSTAEPEGDFWENDVTIWMEWKHEDKWRAVQYYWRIYEQAQQLSNMATFSRVTDNEAVRREWDVLEAYFSKALGEVDKTDVSYTKQLNLLDVQINRLQEMMGVVGEAGVTSSSKAPDRGLPPEFAHPENDVGGWEQYYTEVAATLGPDFLRNQVHEMRDMLESQSDIDSSFSHKFHEGKRWDGLHRAMHYYSGPEQDDIHERAVLFEKYKILFEAQVSPCHSWSMTCDMDQLPDWEHHKVHAGLFDYFTLSESEVRVDENGEEKEERYKHSHHVRKLVHRLMEILHENPEPGFKSRTDGGSAIQNGIHQKGWFGYYYWKDDGDNKDELLVRMEHELKKDIAPDLSDEDAADVIFFAHRTATMCGIRQDLFTPYMASGATPVDMLGDQSKYIGEVNIYAPELYSAYKKRKYLQLAEMIGIPEDWWESIKGSADKGIEGHKKASKTRMNAVERSYKASRLLCQTMSNPLREPSLIPIEAGTINIRNTYFSMFDFFFKDEVTKRRRNNSVTLKAWKRGKGEFVKFRQSCFDTPGEIDVSKINGLSEKELIKKLAQHVDHLINDGISYMKKNYDMVQWKDMAIMTRWAIDRCFRVYAKKDKTFKGSKKLLRRVRAVLTQAETAKGAGKARENDVRNIIKVHLENLSNNRMTEAEVEEEVKKYTLDETTGVIDYLNETQNRREHLNDVQIKQLEAGGVMLSPLSKKEGVARVVDVPEFLLESYPNWTMVNFAGVFADEGINLSKTKVQLPRRTSDEMEIIMPAVDGRGWIEKPGKKAKFAVLTSDYLTEEEYAGFKESAEEGIFGMKPLEQQKDPDEEKK